MMQSQLVEMLIALFLLPVMATIGACLIVELFKEFAG